MKCLICNKDFGERYISGSHFKTHNITGKEYYDKFLKKSDEGICQNCGSNTKYHGKISRGYSRYCSRTCWLKTDTHREIVRNTMKNKIRFPLSLQKNLSNSTGLNFQHVILLVY